MRKKRDPKVGTGKKPKGSGRRLYTDENPKDTVSIKFKTMADATATVNKVKRIKKPFARKIQILTVGEQRAKKKAAGGEMSLKPIPANNKGLPKLPKKVRNKMGFMRSGDEVMMVQGRGCGAMMNSKRKKTRVPRS